MRLVDADKLYPDCLTKDGKLAISQSQLANAPTVPNEYMRGYEAAEREYKRPQGEFTDLEREVTADAINYLLGAELLEENGYTEAVTNALKSALQKIGAEENHL